MKSMIDNTVNMTIIMMNILIQSRRIHIGTRAQIKMMMFPPTTTPKSAHHYSEKHCETSCQIRAWAPSTILLPLLSTAPVLIHRACEKDFKIVMYIQQVGSQRKCRDRARLSPRWSASTEPFPGNPKINLETYRLSEMCTGNVKKRTDRVKCTLETSARTGPIVRSWWSDLKESR